MWRNWRLLEKIVRKNKAKDKHKIKNVSDIYVVPTSTNMVAAGLEVATNMRGPS